MKRWIAPLAALAIFIFLTIAFFAAAAATRPSKVTVLAAARDLQPGDVLTASDLQEIQVYKDARVSTYIPAKRKDAIVGGVVVLPASAGAPLTKLGIASVGTADARLIGLLADFPDMAIFPLPLDLQTVVAPEIDNFHVGDIVALTVVYGDRPSLPENPAAAAQQMAGGFIIANATPTPVAEATPTPSMMDYTERGKPPVAKTFDRGYRVVAVLGKQPAPQADNQDRTSPYTAAGVTPPRPILMLLVPQEDIQPLSLAVSQGRVFVSFALKVKPQPGGFSYWDFEAMLKEERERLQQEKNATPTAPPTASMTPTVTPAATPTPQQ